MLENALQYVIIEATVIQLHIGLQALLVFRESNMKEYLVDLIKSMSEKDDARTSDSSVSWQAHREAESLSDPSAFPILIEMIESSPQKKARDMRDNAYFIIGKLLKNSFDREACDFLIRRLNAEDNKYVLSHILDRLAELTLPIEMDITPIVSCSKSEKWLVRHSALCALGASATKQSRDALAFYLEQDDEKQYRYEMIYANASLGRIGNAEDIPLIEKHLHSRSPRIRESARFAIERIKLGGN